MHLYVHSNIIYSSQDLETAQVPISTWVDKNVVHLYNGILSSSNKDRILTFCKSMDGTGGLC